MEYLAVVVANKNQISSLSPLIGANWPGAVSDQTFPILKLFFSALKKLDLTSNHLKEVHLKQNVAWSSLIIPQIPPGAWRAWRLY